MSSSEHEEAIQKIHYLMRKVAVKASNKVCVFRGEDRKYDTVSSGLYREQRAEIRSGIPMAIIEHQETRYAQTYFGQTNKETEDIEILSQIQHYGGKTNLIDFSKDLNVALFFAIDGHYSDDGRIILLERNPSGPIKFHEPQEPEDRAPAQKSILVHSAEGFLREYSEIAVPKEMKHILSNYLHRYHQIDQTTMYAGPIGFIKHSQRRFRAKSLAQKGLVKLNEGKFKETVARCTEALDDYITPEALGYRGNAHRALGNYDQAITDLKMALAMNPYLSPCRIELGYVYLNKAETEHAIKWFKKALKTPMPITQQAEAHNGLGHAYLRQSKYQEAILEFTNGIESCKHHAKNEGKPSGDAIAEESRLAYDAIVSQIQHSYSTGLCGRGKAHMHLQNWEESKRDLMNAREQGTDIAKSFREDYQDIQEFESKLNCKVPKELAIFLEN